MSPAKTNQLITQYPKVFSQLKHLECSDGWFNLINSLCGLIEFYLKQLPVEMQDQIHAVQIKQKYGGLRAYFNHTTPYLDGAIALAEDISNNMCEVCGNYGGHKSFNGWIITLCDKHYKAELKKKIKKEDAK